MNIEATCNRMAPGHEILSASLFLDMQVGRSVKAQYIAQNKLRTTTTKMTVTKAQLKARRPI